VETALGPIEVYEIPEDQKGAVLEKLYPGHPIPKLETMMDDIHAEKTFRVKEFYGIKRGGYEYYGQSLLSRKRRNGHRLDSGRKEEKAAVEMPRLSPKRALKSANAFLSGR
jgi:hypothetical protein